jgi:predicted O-methyltransferase YrrM
MQKTNLINVARFVVKSPKRALELFHKVRERIFDRASTLKKEELDKWLKENAADLEPHLIKIDSQLWEEAKKFHEDFKHKAAGKLEKLPFKMGGGGHYPLLYFLVRRLKPSVVVETGVSSGFSTQAILKAMQINGSGKLYSSDFPLFRIKDPEKYIGILVDEDLKKDWKLFIEGDRISLPKICNQVDHIDIFHYDSDKSYKGREFALKTISSKTNKDSLIIFDDIHNNSHFYDYVRTNNITNYKVFFFINKYVGFIGELG